MEPSLLCDLFSESIYYFKWQHSLLQGALTCVQTVIQFIVLRLSQAERMLKVIFQFEDSKMAFEAF